MQGYLITFFTQQDRMHGHMPLAQWLLSEAKLLGIRGATLSGSIEGLGHDGKTHAINLFDFSDQPVQIALVVSDEEAERFFVHLRQEKVSAFYMKIPAEFGISGGEDAGASTA